MSGPLLTTPISITQINLGDSVNPTIANQPHTDIEANVQMIYNYLKNDGASSGINSDLLDGQHGVYYLDLTNATNTLLAASFTDTSHGVRAGGTLHANATTSVAGFLSASDKTKLDGIATNANNYVLPAATTIALGGIKAGTGLSVAVDGTLSVNTVIATTSTLGNVIVAGNLTVDGSGNLSVDTTKVPLLASANVFTMTQTAPYFNSTSARELKTNIEEFNVASLDFTKLQPKEWDWLPESGLEGHAIGALADEVAQVLPSVVGFNSEGKAISIDYGRLAYIMISKLISKLGG